MKDDKKKRGPRKAAMGQDDVAHKRTRMLKADLVIDYRDHEFLRKFMTERGKILPGRLTGANSKQQRQIKKAIRRDRVMGLLP